MLIKNSFLYLSLLLFAFANCLEQTKKQSTETDEGIPLASMADVSIDSAVINKIDTAVRNGTYPNIHSLLVARNGKLVYEKYWPGKDESWGQGLGIITHGKDSLHDIRSISKSIVSASIGIAVQQGKIKTLTRKYLIFFPNMQSWIPG